MTDNNPRGAVCGAQLAIPDRSCSSGRLNELEVEVDPHHQPGALRSVRTA